MGLQKTLRDYDSIFIALDHFSKMAHFIPRTKMADATHIAEPSGGNSELSWSILAPAIHKQMARQR